MIETVWVRAPAASLARVATEALTVSRYDIGYVEIFASARKHGVSDLDIEHAIQHALAAGEQDDGKVLYLGPDRSGNLLEVVAVLRDSGAEVVIHAMRMRRMYQTFLHESGDANG